MEKNLSQEVLEKIEEKHLKPKSKWEFRAKSYFVWAVFSLAVLVGSMTSAIIIFMLEHNNWNNAPALGMVRVVFFGLPYFWFLALVILTTIAVYDFKYTKRGYKIKPTVVVAASVLASIILGVAVYAVGGGEKIESLVYRRVPIYMRIMHWQGRPFIAISEGRLAGVVTRGESSKRFEIRDFMGRLWVLICEQPVESNCKIVHDGLRVMAVGQKISEEEFEVEFIKEFLGKGLMPKPHCPDGVCNFQRRVFGN